MKTLIWRLPWQQIASFYTRCILVYYSATTDVSATSRNGLMVTQGLKSGCIIQCSQTTWGRRSLLRCWRYAHSQVYKNKFVHVEFALISNDFIKMVYILSKIACFILYQMIKIAWVTPFWHIVLAPKLLSGNNLIPFINFVNIFAKQSIRNSNSFSFWNEFIFHNLWRNVKLSNFVHSNCLLLIESQRRDSHRFAIYILRYGTADR